MQSCARRSALLCRWIKQMVFEVFSGYHHGPSCHQRLCHVRLCRRHCLSAASSVNLLDVKEYNTILSNSDKGISARAFTLFCDEGSQWWWIKPGRHPVLCVVYSFFAGSLQIITTIVFFFCDHVIYMQIALLSPVTTPLLTGFVWIKMRVLVYGSQLQFSSKSFSCSGLNAGKDILSAWHQDLSKVRQGFWWRCL